MTARLLPFTALLVLVGCVRPPQPTVVRADAVAVFPVYNETGDPLLIAGESLLEKYLLGTERYTVPDALAAVARARLARQGFGIVPPAEVDAAVGGDPPQSGAEAVGTAARHKIEGAVLFIAVRRWEPDNHFQPRFIIAAVTVQLIDVATGHIIWSAENPARPIKTPGAINFGQAYSIAAETLMIDLLAPLRPAGPAQPPPP